MSLCNLLQQDLKEARLARTNTVKIDVLKMVVNRFQTEAKNELRDATDEDGTKAINYYLKGAREVIAQMAKLGMLTDPRFDQARQEVEILLAYLPKQLDDVELLEAIRAVGVRDFGAVMKSLRAEFGNNFDAKRAKELFTKDESKG